MLASRLRARSVAKCGHCAWSLAVVPARSRRQIVQRPLRAQEQQPSRRKHGGGRPVRAAVHPRRRQVLNAQAVEAAARHRKRLAHVTAEYRFQQRSATCARIRAHTASARLSEVEGHAGHLCAPSQRRGHARNGRLLTHRDRNQDVAGDAKGPAGSIASVLPRMQPTNLMAETQDILPQGPGASVAALHPGRAVAPTSACADNLPDRRSARRHGERSPRLVCLPVTTNKYDRSSSRTKHGGRQRAMRVRGPA